MKKIITYTFAAAMAAAASAQQLGTHTWPYFDDVTPGQWTMNYDGALAASKADGRDVVLYFSGSQWCGDCNGFARNVLDKPLWQASAADTYLVLLDFEGRGAAATQPTLLQMPTYYSDYANLTAAAARNVIIRNYDLQHAYAGLLGAAHPAVRGTYNAGTGVKNYTYVLAALQTKYAPDIPNNYKTIWFPTLVVLKGKQGNDPQFIGGFRETECGIPNSSATVLASTQNAVNLLYSMAGRTYVPGKLGFVGFGDPMVPFPSATQPALTGVAGSTQTIWVSRTDGKDGGIVATVTGGGATHTLIWNDRDTAPKSFNLALPDIPADALFENITLSINIGVNDGGGATLKSTRLGQLPITVVSKNLSGFTDPENNVFPDLVTGVYYKFELPFSNATAGAVSAKVVSGKLPVGLKLKVEGNNVVIAGVPKKAADVTVGIQLFIKVGRQTFTTEILPVKLTVTPFTQINPNLVGTYNASLASQNDGGFGSIAGLMKLTVSRTGRVTMKTQVEGQAISASGAWALATPAGVFGFGKTITQNGKQYVVGVFVDGETVSGQFSTAEDYTVSGTRNIWSRANPATECAGYYTLLLPPNADDTVVPAGAVTNIPSGYGYLTFTVRANNGATRYSGKLADGTSLSGSSTLQLMAGFPAHLVPVYRPLYSRTGHFGAALLIMDNAVHIAQANWLNRGRKAFLDEDAFWMLNMDAENVGGLYNKTQELSGYYQYGFTAANPGLGFQNRNGIFELDPELLPEQLTFTAGASGGFKLGANPLKATLTATRSSGLVRGRFPVTFTNATGKVKTISNSFNGVLTPYDTSELGGAGYYLMPDNTLPAPFKTLKFSFPIFIEELE